MNCMISASISPHRHRARRHYLEARTLSIASSHKTIGKSISISPMPLFDVSHRLTTLIRPLALRPWRLANCPLNLRPLRHWMSRLQPCTSHRFMISLVDTSKDQALAQRHPCRLALGSSIQMPITRRRQCLQCDREDSVMIEACCSKIQGIVGTIWDLWGLLSVRI